MKRLIQIVLVAAVAVLLVVSCSAPGGGSGGTSTSSTPPAWTTVFQDNFDRANTTGMSLGSDWSIIGSGSDEMYITSNQVHSHFTASSGPGVIAVYNGTVDYSKPLRVSVKGMVSAPGASPTEFLGVEINANATTYAGYYETLTYDGAKLWLKLARTDGTNDLNPPAPAMSDITAFVNQGVWYILEIESSGSTITARMKDATGVTFGTATITDTTATRLTGGSVVFYNYITANGVPMSPSPGYSAEFDDFKIESYQ
jgi:hypothetical protein